METSVKTRIEFSLHEDATLCLWAEVPKLNIKGWELSTGVGILAENWKELALQSLRQQLRERSQDFIISNDSELLSEEELALAKNVANDNFELVEV